jgi:hypothetical protein
MCGIGFLLQAGNREIKVQSSHLNANHSQKSDYSGVKNMNLFVA